MLENEVKNCVWGEVQTPILVCWCIGYYYSWSKDSNDFCFMLLEFRVSSARGLLDLSQITSWHMGCQRSYFSLTCALALEVKVSELELVQHVSFWSKLRCLASSATRSVGVVL